MGNNIAQVTSAARVNAGAAPTSSDLRVGQFVVPKCGSSAPSSARRPAPPALSDDVVSDAPTRLSPPRDRVGAPTNDRRCIALCEFIIQSPARTHGHVCMDIRLPDPFRHCALGHTSVPTTSSLFQRFSKVHGLMT